MSAALVVLPMVWATEEAAPRKTGFQRQADATVRERARVQTLIAQLIKEHRPDPSLAFYRKYTEALLRRYVRLSMSAGRVPSLLGRELFRGKVTNYRVEGFDDMVIFVQDVEQCVAKLDRGQQILIERIAMQEYTQAEAAELLRLPLRSVLRWYGEALDVLTEMFLDKQLLEPRKSCQEG
jgi:hypothetical protein